MSNFNILLNFPLALPPSRFGEPPLPALPIPLSSSGDEELFSPGINDLSPNCCGDVSPTFEKPSYREMEKTMEASRFVAQHVKNKDKFEQVSKFFMPIKPTQKNVLQNWNFSFIFLPHFNITMKKISLN